MNKGLSILKKYWNYDGFLPNQESIINGILDKRDTVALIPTGGGKSMCFQIPALILEGTCIVISPLIALIDDQIQRLKSMNINAEGLHSGLDIAQQNDIVQKLVGGKLDLIYISPEKLQSKKFKNIIRSIKISFVAVDEAHCISQWGYDFRPDYHKIANIKEIFPDIPIAAFTATANKKTLNDIIKYLELKNPKITKGSFLKSNISFGIIETEKKLRVLGILLKEFTGSGIIYLRSRRGTVVLADLLRKTGENARCYHAGMDAENRRQVQSDWLTNKTRIIVSTTAFGMGIDKADVRFVIHFDLPASIEEYYQEAGRAGRDRKKSNVVLIYNKNDLSVLKKNNLDTFPSKEDIDNTYINLFDFLNIDNNIHGSETKNIDLEEFYRYNKLNNFKTYKCISELERYGFISLNIPVRDRFSKLKLNFDPDYLENLKALDSEAYKVFKSAILFYEGLFLSPTHISEVKISKKSGVSIQSVIEILSKYSENKLIAYERQKSKFSISFLKKENLSINKSELVFRKKIMEKNIKSISDYLVYTECRQRFILKYFDEKLNKTCKICDICLGVENTNFTKPEFDSFRKKINDFQFDKNTDINDLIFLDTYLNRNKNIKMLKSFFKTGELIAIGNRIIKKNPINT